MSSHDRAEHAHSRPAAAIFLTSRAGLVLIGFLIIAGALMFTEHSAHVLGVLLYLPLIACPLMHFFMHGGHGHGDHGGGGQQNQERNTP